MSANTAVAPSRRATFARPIVAVVVFVAALLVPAGIGRAAAAPVSLQVVTVQAASAHSTTAALDLWSRSADGSYRHVYGPVRAFVGSAGVGPTREGLSRTPAGVFTLTQAFGNQATTATKLPYFRAGVRDWWDENPASATYNRHVVRTRSPGGNSENLYYAGRAYASAVVINYNTKPVVKGAGSGFFLHVSTGGPTAGCVSVPTAPLAAILRWLDPARSPRISIGVGAAATKVLAGPRTAPAWPAGHRPFHRGDVSAYVAMWQRQMHSRGVASLTGTGRFGDHTDAAVRRLQRLAALPVTGLLDGRSWPLAWTGRY